MNGRDRAGPWGPKGERVVDAMVREARAWVEHDGGSHDDLPLLFAVALAEAIGMQPTAHVVGAREDGSA